MYKFRLLPISVAVLVCLITLFASSRLFSTTLNSTPVLPTLAPPLSPDDFIKKVQNNDKTVVQAGLDQTLTNLLGAPQPSSTIAAPLPVAPTDTSQQTPPAAETTSTNNPPPTTTNTTPTSGFNPYAN